MIYLADKEDFSEKSNNKKVKNTILYGFSQSYLVSFVRRFSLI